jgi:hypothetical protein
MLVSALCIWWVLEQPQLWFLSNLLCRVAPAASAESPTEAIDFSGTTRVETKALFAAALLRIGLSQAIFPIVHKRGR